MKSFKKLFILACVLNTVWVYAEPSTKGSISEKHVFRAGEKLTFLLHYGIIKGGTATLSLKDSQVRDIPALHARMYARTIGVTDKIFKIEDTYESYFHHTESFPYKSIRNIHEGGYKYLNEVDFVYKDTLVYSKKSGKRKVPKGTLDMVSAFYYLRTLNLDTLKKGDEILVNTFFDDDVFPFRLRYKGREKVKTRLGKVWCHRFDPIVEPGRIFKSEDDMSVWLTDDSNKIPIMVKFDLIVGSVKCELIEYENINTAIQWE